MQRSQVNEMSVISDLHSILVVCFGVTIFFMHLRILYDKIIIYDYRLKYMLHRA